MSKDHDRSKLTLALITSLSISPLIANQSRAYSDKDFKFVNINKNVQADAPANSIAGGADLIASGERALDLEQYSRAEELFLQAQRDKNISDKEYAHVMCCLGETYLWEGKFELAKKTLEKALSLAQKLKPADPVLLARCLDSNAWMLQQTGDQTRSIDLCSQAVELQRRNQPANSLDLAETIEHLATLKAGAGQMADAAQLYQQAIDIRKSAKEASPAMLANDVERLAAILLKQGQTDEAARAFKLSLDMKQSTNAVLAPYAPHSYTENIEYNFVPGAPNCAQQFADGNLIQSVTANGVTVQATVLASPSDLKKNSRIGVSLQNDSAQPVTLLSQSATFMILSPKPKFAQQVSTSALADNLEKKAAKKAGWVRFWGNQATLTSNTTMMNMGGYGGPYGYYPPGFIGPNYYSRNNGNMATMTTSVPDLAARARAMEKAQAIQDKSAAQANDLRQSAIGQSTVAPGAKVEGALDFDQSTFNQAILRVPVGNAVFVFTFDRSGKK